MINSHFSSVSDFLQMGGYAGYVWSAYAAVLLVLAVVALRSCVRFKSK